MRRKYLERVDKLNKTLLINRIDPENQSNKKKKIFFLIGKLNKSHVKEKLVDIIESIDISKKKDIIYKYNGIELNIKEKQIPGIIKTLVKNDIEIYSIYEVYNPEL